MDDVTRLRWMIGGMFPFIFALAGTYRLRAQRIGGPVSRRAEGVPLMIALRLSALAVFVLLVWWLVAPGAPVLFAATIPMPVRYAGAGMAWAGLLLQWWVFHSLGLNLTDTVTVREKATLVSHGPYRWIRHPLYTVATLLMIGLTLVAASLSMLIAGAAWFAMIRMRTPIEEAKLIERFGDSYREYMRRTGGFLPRPGRRTPR